VLRTAKAMLTDSLRALGSFIAAPVYAALCLLGMLTNRPDAKARFFASAKDEALRGLLATYRVFIGHPLRLIGAQRIVERLEKGLPPAIEDVWGEVLTPSTQLFPGYQVLRTMQGGGSGAKLYVAVPTSSPAARTREALARTSSQRSLAAAEGTVVIKSFALTQGSQLPQIVRESRALEAGKALGLILDDGLTSERFWYAMRYIPGQSLRLAANELHARDDNAQGLTEGSLAIILTWMSDLLLTLERYHNAGLWHKDVKPDNIIIEAPDAALNDAAPKATPPSPLASRRAVLVDLGLVSSLDSAMTLTTHGTEYFRDPEMVRRALRGARVMDVDGVRFDIYSAGAVLYAMIENSFPAQSELSPITKRCPRAIAWIIKRAMAPYDQRYTSASAMLQDLRHVQSSPDPFAVRPATLPSMQDSQDSP
jgi:serine/threonine protein kinase